MAYDEAFAAFRCPAEIASDDLTVGATDAEGERAYQYRSVRRRRWSDLFEFNGIWLPGPNGKRTHKRPSCGPRVLNSKVRFRFGWIINSSGLPFAGTGEFQFCLLHRAPGAAKSFGPTELAVLSAIRGTGGSLRTGC